ncbi:MAG: hypothetical protein EHM24_27350 [Acidobacteria bacterium]|nr:MAG: hypothetical protein EHM24_27350 [Acidobacteriota bacterium]
MQADTLWWLFGALWRLSREARPGLSATERRADIEALIEPARSASNPPALQAAAIVALFEAVLIASLGWVPPLVPQGE